jgi:hypothetical protein
MNANNSMTDKTSHLKPRIGNFDSRFGWQRDIIMGRPHYSLWRIFKGKRYLVSCTSTRNTPRSTIANDLVVARMSLRKYMARCMAAGKTVENYASKERVETDVTQYRRGQTRWKEKNGK